MRIVLICGDRNWRRDDTIEDELKKLHKKSRIDLVIEGGAEGADTDGRDAAMGMGIPVMECQANWRYYGKKAGPIRNQMQLNVAIALGGINVQEDYKIFDKVMPYNLLVLAFHSDLKNSKGTKDMVNRAKKAGVKVKVIK